MRQNRRVCGARSRMEASGEVRKAHGIGALVDAR